MCIPGRKHRLFDLMASVFIPWAISKAHTIHFNLLLLGETLRWCIWVNSSKFLEWIIIVPDSLILIVILFFFKYLLKSFCVLCVHILPNMGPCTQGGQRYWVSWSWNDRWLWPTWREYGELNLSSLEEEHAPLSGELPLQPVRRCLPSAFILPYSAVEGSWYRFVCFECKITPAPTAHVSKDPLQGHGNFEKWLERESLT